ncbi:hypothetical protein PBI_SCTP2_94 [Salicola phage SCTP-2]|nr:hypothetical protein PBI_SCTP2_94 [Salicola phage SCTP-2]
MGIENLISKLGLEDYKEDLQEAWNEAVEQNKAELEEQYKQKFDQEIKTMVTAADSLIKESLNKELSEFNEDRKKVYEAKKQLLNRLKQARQLKESYQKKNENRVQVFENFVMQTLKEELKEFKGDRDNLQESLNNEKLKLRKERMRHKKLSESKEKAMNNLVTNVLKSELKEFKEDRQNMVENLNKMENLVVGQLTEELSEFQEDRQKLKEKKIELQNDFKNKLKEAKKAYVNRMANSAEKLVNESLRNELSTLKEDIRSAKENAFGRKLFEAFVSEFYHSHLSENTELVKTAKKLNESNKNVQKLQKIVEKQNKELNKSKKLLKETHEHNKHERKVDELTKSLPETKQKIMKNLLEGVEYEKLDSTFERYLPSVLENDKKNNGQKEQGGQKRKMVTEGKKNNASYREVTGKREKREKTTTDLHESKEDQDVEQELTQMLINAGIKKN